MRAVGILGVLDEIAGPLDAGRVRKSVIGGKYKLVDSPLSVFMIMGHDKLNTLQCKMLTSVVGH